MNAITQGYHALSYVTAVIVAIRMKRQVKIVVNREKYILIAANDFK